MVLNVMCYTFLRHGVLSLMPHAGLCQAVRWIRHVLKNWTKSTLHFFTSKSFNV